MENLFGLKYDTLRGIFDEIRGVWIADEILSKCLISSALVMSLRSLDIPAYLPLVIH